MGYCNRRTDRFGRPRYTAMFLDTDGKHHSAGTYSTKKEAMDAWQSAEARVKEGRGHHLIRGRVLFRVYVEQDWLPNLAVGTKTRENYSYELYAHIMPFFGEKRMLDIRASEIKRWLTKLKESGVSPASRKYLKALLSTIFSNAVREEIVPGNPCLLVKTEKVPKRHLDIITPAQFDKFYTALADEMWKLLVETAIETGMRWGELTELRVKDFDHGRSLLKVSRAVVQISPKFHPEGGRFLVKPPKNHEQRVVKIAQHLADKVDAHISEHDLKNDDLLFWYAPATVRLQTKTLDPKELGWTEPNEKGRTYRHGTTSAYAAARCRCDHCREAVAAYRRKRRADGKDNPREPRR